MRGFEGRMSESLNHLIPCLSFFFMNMLLTSVIVYLAIGMRKPASISSNEILPVPVVFNSTSAGIHSATGDPIPHSFYPDQGLRLYSLFLPLFFVFITVGCNETW